MTNPKRCTLCSAVVIPGHCDGSKRLCTACWPLLRIHPAYNYRGWRGSAWRDEVRVLNPAQDASISASKRRAGWVWTARRDGEVVEMGEHRLRYKALDAAIAALRGSDDQNQSAQQV